MIRLFWKVFLGFWLTTILIILGTALVIHKFDPGGFPKPPRAPLFNQDPHAMRLLHFATRDAVNSSEIEFVNRLRTMPPWSLRSVYVVNDQGHDLLGRRLPAPVEELIRSLDNRRPFQRFERQKKQYFGRLIQLEDGQIIRMVVSSQDGQPNLLLKLFLINLWPILLISVLVSGSLSYLLGRYLARPAEILKDATQRLAGGDFDYRVAPKMRGRRDEMSSLAQAFDQMAEQLQQSMAMQQRLIKDVSHELRSPLMRLQSALGLAQQQLDNTQVADHIAKAQQAAEYLNNIISDILSLPINAGEDWPLEDVIDVCVLVETLLAELKPVAVSKDVQLNFRQPLAGEALVQTRGNTLVGVFENVFANAIRHTPPAGHIDVEVKISEGCWQIVISDSGPGLANAELEKIFTPFYRTDDARDRSLGGVGLGLSIARRTVSLHGGKIWAEAAPKGGLAVNILLPKAKA